jgi:hypothetical protein
MECTAPSRFIGRGPKICQDNDALFELHAVLLLLQGVGVRIGES